MSSSVLPIQSQSIHEGAIFANGWRRGGGDVLPVFDKATGQEMARFGCASTQDVHETALVAASVQLDWASESISNRAAVMNKVATLLEEGWEDAAAWIMRETGGVRPKADFEIATVIAFFRNAASMLKEEQFIPIQATAAVESYIVRKPHGVVGIIAPFNFPLILSMRAVAPALAVGNAVVLKPDPQTPVSGGLMMADIFQAAGLPTGLFNVLPGGVEVGEALCRDACIKMICFTGSTAVGRKVGALAGEHLKRTSLELGGKNALIIMPDANLELAVSAASFGAFFHQGQICMAIGRLIVHETIADKFVELLVKRASDLKMGDPSLGQSALGPLINQRQVERVHSLVKESVESGAKLLVGGQADGLFYPATVLDHVVPGMPVFEDEIFGPVANIVRYKNDEEAIRYANSGQYGLSAGIISKNTEKARFLGAHIRTGMLHINDQTVVHEAHIPFGGFGNSGNGTRVGGIANFDDFTQWQWVTIKDEVPDYRF